VSNEIFYAHRTLVFNYARAEELSDDGTLREVWGTNIPPEF